MELSTVGGRRTSQPPQHHHHHHQHHKQQHQQFKNQFKGSLADAAQQPITKTTQLSPQCLPPFIHGKGGKQMCRYPEDPDMIEILDDDPVKLKPKSVGKKSGSKWTDTRTRTQMNQYEISASTLPHSYLSHHQHLDTNPEYSYAYCEPIVTKLNKSIPDKVGSPTHAGIPTSISSNALSKGPSAHSLRALLSKSFRKSSITNERHTFTTRYGTKENIYEDVGVGTMGRGVVKSQSTESINKVPVEEELKFVQKQHDRIMGELNLSIEALLMPSQDETDQMERRAAEEREQQQQHEIEERFSPTQLPLHLMHHMDFDSGISGSSSSGASYSGSMRYRTTSMYPPRSLTIYEAPSTSSSSSQLTAATTATAAAAPSSLQLSQNPELMMPGKLACCFYGDSSGSSSCRQPPPPPLPLPMSCSECSHADSCSTSSHSQPIESISEKVNFWNKIGKIKGVFNVPGSPKQQSPVNDAPSTSDPTPWNGWKVSGCKQNRIQTQPLPKR